MKTILCLLLVLLPVVGFVNYRRNAPLDEELQNRTSRTRISSR